MHEIIKELRSALAGHVQFALLYGSVLTKYFKSESDIDLAIFVGKPFGLQARIDLQAYLSERVGNKHEVDLLVLDTADPIIAMQVIANGKPIYVADGAAFLNFKVKMISHYLDFKQDRKIIEDKLAAGSVYA